MAVCGSQSSIKQDLLVGYIAAQLTFWEEVIG